MAKRAARCECGRLLADAARSSYRSKEHHWTFYRCECGVEWSKAETVEDVAEPVSSAEVIEVHEVLRNLEGGLDDLLKPKGPA